MALWVHDSPPTGLYYPDETKSNWKEMEELIMLDILERKWWTFAVRGVVAVIFGLLALIWPAQTLVSLVLFFGAYAFLDGVFAIVTGIASIGHYDRWWAVLLEGIVGVAIGLLTFLRPNITALGLVYSIGAWAFITGIFEIVAAIELRRVITDEWMMILSGLLSILFSVVLFVFPGAAGLSLVWLIGIYAIVFGISIIVLAFRLRGLQRQVEKVVKSGK
jgi:uncharacterized membrane protein HdeD (DUF308 family)